MQQVLSLFSGEGLIARVLRSASWLMIGYGGSQAMRLAANLVMTRLLFPEAFGLMTLVSVVTTGLALFSDIGVGPSIAQSKRGDDPAFLDTAWSVQVVRGFVLWGITFLLAWPLAQFYGAEELMWYLPIAGFTLAINGLDPIRVETAHRHLLVGRLTALELMSQAIGIGAMVAIAWWSQSVIALVLGGVIQAAVFLILVWRGLPGRRSHFRWEGAALRELLHFGKWIFLSTAFWFLTSQGDRAILGKFVPLDVLGVYNIGFFLASFPMALGHAVNQRVMIPVYRDKPVQVDPSHRRRQRQLRAGLSAVILSLLLAVAWYGPALVQFLYDDRYLLAGPMVMLIALALTPAVITMTYDQAALAAGDSRSFFVFTASRACAQTLLFLIGVSVFGLVGGIAALGLAMVLAYPVLVWLARKHQVWDPRHDAAFGLLILIAGTGMMWTHWAVIAAMIAATG